MRQYGNEEGVRQTLSRLMGRHWQEAWKIGENLEQADEEDYVADEET
jgi:hypothetical protein